MRIKRLIPILLSAIVALLVTALLLFLMSKLILGMRDGSHASVKMPALVSLQECQAQKQLEFDIDSEIRHSQSCMTDEDCGLLYVGCPFGCDVAVNKSGSERISLAIKAYRQYMNDNECERCRKDCPVRDVKTVCESKVCKRVESSVSEGS